MSTKLTIPVGATNLVKSNPVVRKNNTVTYAGPKDGTATGGTITIDCKAPNGSAFESPTDSAGVTLNTIDISAPEKLNIPGEISQYDITVAGFTGTATEIFLSVSSND